MMTLLLVLLSTLSSAEDFLLWAANRGEGFTAQQLVLTRVQALVVQLAAHRSDSERMTLVMPPVCGQLVHGGDGSERAYRWSDLVDLEHLASHLPVQRVIDVHEHGGAVDVALHALLRSSTDFKQAHWSALAACDAASLLDVQLTHLCWPLDVAELVCVDSFVDADSSALHDHLLRLFRPTCDAAAERCSSSRSVALLRAETLSWGMVWFDGRLERALAALRPAPRLKALADDAVAALRDGRACASGLCLRQWATGADAPLCRALALGVHWRRGDFVTGHAKTTPSAAALAHELAELFDARTAAPGACVFLMTDASGHDKLALLNALNERGWPSGRMVALHDATATLPLPVARLEVEKEIAISAVDVFAGTPPSTVSLWINKKRIAAGHAESTNRELRALYDG